MVRDWELIRQILLRIESLESTRQYIDSREFAAEHKVSDSLVYHQFEILYESGLIQAQDVSSMDGHAMTARALTWQGHEFLDKTRESKLWNDVKDEARKRGISLSFEAIGALCTKLIAVAIANVQ